MSDDNQDPLGRSQGKQPWFGAKRFGYGYGPRTWQGYLVTAVLAAFAITVGALLKGHPALIVVAILPLVLVPFIIGFIQRR
jgi:hypothetical protein